MSKRLTRPSADATATASAAAAVAGRSRGDAGLSPAAGRLSPWLLALVLVGAVLIAYLPVRHAGFIWDDDTHVTNNPCIVGPPGFKGIWSSAGGYYFPLVTTSFWLQHALWSLDPLPYHLVNVVFQAACAVLLWQVLRLLRVRGAWLGALLWALHPVQVESVAWISELKNTQSGIFYLLAIWCFLRWARGANPDAARDAPFDAGLDARGSGWSYALALLFAAAAILSKSATVMLPIVLGLCWWWIKPWRWRRVLWLTPFLALSAAAGIWTIWEQKYHSGASGPEWNVNAFERLIIAGNDIWFYLGKLVWPDPLIFIYPRWSPDAARLVSYLPLLAAIAGFGALWWWRRRVRSVFFAAGYFGASLFPVLGLFDVYFFRYSYVGDHFQYLASMGALALAVAGIVTAFDRTGRNAVIPAVLILIPLGLLTWRHVGDFRTDEALYRATLARHPDCWMAHYNLGHLLQRSGRLQEAMAHYDRAMQVNPDAPDVRTAFGTVLQEMGRGGEAVAHFEQALRLDPNYPDAHNHLGVALAKAGRLDEAIAHFERALRAKPALPEVHNNLGNALRAAGRERDALAQYELALRLKPDFVDAHVNLGITLGLAHRLPEAIVHFEQALRLNPDLAQVHMNLAVIFGSMGRSAEAAAHYEAARRTGGPVPLRR